MDIIIGLSQSFDELKQGIHKSRLSNAAKSMRKGAVTRELVNISDIDEGYRLVRQTYKRIGLPSPQITLFRGVMDTLSPMEMVRCYGMFYDEDMIGFRMVLIYKGTMHDYYAGSKSEHSNKYPNDVLILKVLKMGCESDCNRFVFGGAGKPGVPYGVRDHKLKFGGTLVEYGRYVGINNGLLYRLGSAVVKMKSSLLKSKSN